jgi:hypothetical protein
MEITTPLQALAVLALTWGAGVGILAIVEIHWTLKNRKAEIKRLTQVVRELNDELANA